MGPVNGMAIPCRLVVLERFLGIPIRRILDIKALIPMPQVPNGVVMVSLRRHLVMVVALLTTSLVTSTEAYLFSDISRYLSK